MKQFLLAVLINAFVATAAFATVGLPQPHPEINCRVLVC